LPRLPLTHRRGPEALRWELFRKRALANGGIKNFDKGMEMQGQLWRRIVHEYLQRCDSAGLDRRPRCILPTDFSKLVEAAA
jgi:hypothetical protein